MRYVTKARHRYFSKILRLSDFRPKSEWRIYKYSPPDSCRLDRVSILFLLDRAHEARDPSWHFRSSQINTWSGREVASLYGNPYRKSINTDRALLVCQQHVWHSGRTVTRDQCEVSCSNPGSDGIFKIPPPRQKSMGSWVSMGRRPYGYECDLRWSWGSVVVEGLIIPQKNRLITCSSAQNPKKCS